MFVDYGGNGGLAFFIQLSKLMYPGFGEVYSMPGTMFGYYMPVIDEVVMYRVTKIAQFNKIIQIPR